MRWSRAPIARIVIPFAVGITYAVLWKTPSLRLSIFLTLSFFIFFLVSHFYFRKLRYKQRWLPGLFINSALVFTGITLVNAHKADTKPDYFIKKYNYTENENASLLLRLTNPPEEKNKTYKVIAEVKAIAKADKLIPATGNILLYFRKDSLSKSLKYGDVILTYSKPQLIPNPANPEEFDYSRYMALRNVYYQLFLNESGWLKTSVSEAKPAWQFLFSLQKQWAQFFEENINGNDEAAIAKALVLGDVSDLSPQLMSSYAVTGTLHILSVSGLHIGFIFLALNILTTYLQRNRYGRIIRICIILGFLWAYAFLTGLSPSVFRSVVMFSFVAIGQSTRKITNTYNSICTAALILLLTDPFLIANVGAQLSFIALLGIVWLQPEIYKLWQPENKLIDKIWSVTAVSIAAQVAAFPIGLFYFNQFPMFFLISNLIAIPISFFVLAAGYIFIIARLLQLTFLYPFIGKILYAAIYVMNYLMKKIEFLPFSQLEGIYLRPWECILLYLFIIFICLSFIYKNKLWLKLSLGILLLFVTQRLFLFINTYKTPKLVIHSVAKNFAMSIKDKNKMYLIGDSAFIKDESKVKFLLARYAYKNFVSKEDIIQKAIDNDQFLETKQIHSDKNSGQFRNIKWLLLNKNLPIENLTSNIPVDYLIIDGNPKLNIKEIAGKLSFKNLVITKNNSRYKAEKWDKECRDLNINCINIQKDNSFAVLE